MNIKHIFSLAVLAVMTAACSSEDIIQQQAASRIGQTLPFRATISNSAGTRGLTAPADDNSDITAAWEENEKIALVHSTLNNENKLIVDVMTVEEVATDGKSATIAGTATYIDDNDEVYLVYVGHNDNMTNFQGLLSTALGDNSDKTIDKIIGIALEAILAVTTQDGTLGTISNNLDFRLGTSKLKQTNGWATFSTDAPTLSSQFVIWKLSLTTDGTTALEAQTLEITCGGDTYTIDPSGDTTLSTFYVLLPASTNATYDFKATAASGNFSCSHSGITLKAGKFYRSTLTVSKLAGSINYMATEIYKRVSDPDFTNALTNNGDGVANYTSSNTSVAIVAADGKVHIVGNGLTYITATVADGTDYSYTTNSVQYKLMVVQVHNGEEYIEMGDGLNWAIHNYGASKPEQYGDYFAWGEKQTRSIYNANIYFGDEDGDIRTKYSTINSGKSGNCVDNKTTLESSDDVAASNWQQGWRIPTKSEWESLLNTNNYTFTWTYDYNGTGVKGIIVTCKSGSYEGNSIFLPATGNKLYDLFAEDGECCYYWSSSLCAETPSHAWCIEFGKFNSFTDYLGRMLGLTIRPVWKP